MIMEDNNKFGRKGKNKQMVGSDYNTRIVNRVMRMMTNELAVTYART